MRILKYTLYLLALVFFTGNCNAQQNKRAYLNHISDPELERIEQIQDSEEKNIELMYYQAERDIRDGRAKLLAIQEEFRNDLQVYYDMYDAGVISKKDYQNAQVYINYIIEISEYAYVSKRLTGVPMSFKIAQAMLESDKGRSNVAVNSNNHFGLKIAGQDYSDPFFEQWSNNLGRYTTPNCDGIPGADPCSYVKYPDLYSSFIHSSLYYVNVVSYKNMNKDVAPFIYRNVHNTNKFSKWVEATMYARYATGSRYDEKLIKLYKDWKLSRFDSIFSEITIQTLRDDNFFRCTGFYKDKRKM